MFKRLAILGAAAVALAAAPAAQAAPLLVGGMSISSVNVAAGKSPVVPVDATGATVTDYTAATALDFTTTGSTTPGVPGLFEVDGTYGDFDLLYLSTGTIRDFTFVGDGNLPDFPAPPITGFQVIDAPLFSFDLLELNVVVPDALTLSLRGTGLFHLVGYAATPGTFVFTANTTGSTFSFSASEGIPTAVPEPLSLMLLGSGLLGLAAIRRRTMR